MKKNLRYGEVRGSMIAKPMEYYHGKASSLTMLATLLGHERQGKYALPASGIFFDDAGASQALATG